MVTLFVFVILLSMLYLRQYYLNKRRIETYVSHIPKIIHQVYVQGYDEIPECVKTIIAFNRKQNPEYTFKIYNYNNIDEYLKLNTDSVVYQAFKYINPECYACIADFFRYVVIYHEGGIYADIKTKFVKPLDEWIYNDSKIKLTLWPWFKHSHLEKYYPKNFIFKSQNREINQSVLIYPQKHHLLKKVISGMVNKIYEQHNNPKSAQSILDTTGPHLYTKIIAPYLNDHNIYLSQNIHQLFDGNVIYDGTKGCYHAHQKKHNLRWGKIKNKFI